MLSFCFCFWQLVCEVFLYYLHSLSGSLFCILIKSLCLQGFKTKDGYLVVASGNDQQFMKVCKVLCMNGLADSPKYKSNKLRVQHRKELLQILSERFMEETTGEWLRRFEGTGVPCGPINNIQQVFANPQVSDAHFSGHPRDVKENMIHQTRPPSSIAPWSSSDAHVPTVGSFGGGQGTSINFLSKLSYSSSSVGSDLTGQPSLPTCLNEPWPPMTLSPVHRCSFLGPLLIDTDHCRPGTPHKSCSFGDALTQSSSHHNLALVKLAQILTLAHFSCF
ncbi:Succinate--hydroxymethylglutarate CoA-transferase [Anabarilius grahami]|uniref:Succinate--hydroxymethylglutarate CoA-transferase n=1 Tax=Anabarilius grahami TaxID=495550 RepID=A0A3N0XMU4_ANAGA|nr:Succinate--hydroxymethylglutarate CoA-transferase [Anabarilius grahami]